VPLFDKRKNARASGNMTDKRIHTQEAYLRRSKPETKTKETRESMLSI
jgi:hypothetical protein